MSAAEDLVRHSEGEARRILRQRRKTTRTSCYPCRSRKVRCDKQLPCDTCVKRGYAELCSYTNPTRDGAAIISVASSHPSPSHQHAFASSTQDGLNRQMPEGSDTRAASLSHDHRQDRSEMPMEETVDESRTDPFLGTDSMPAFLRQQEPQHLSNQETPSRTVEGAILPVLGLQSSDDSPYPFLPTSLPSTDQPVVKVEQVLPPDHEIIRLFQLYRQESHLFSPIIPDLDLFEHDLCDYLDRRTAGRKSTGISFHKGNQSLPRTQSDAWLGSLFAVLASGIQYSTLSKDERRRKSRLYMQNSFQCLRVTNFLARPSLVSLQTLLILGNVLQNDMQPEAAWILLGTTGRIAQSLGLHRDNGESDSASHSRESLWRAVLWQDSLLSLCFDRTSIMAYTMTHVDISNNLSYIDAMQALSRISLEHISRKTHNGEPEFATVIESVSKVEEVQYQSRHLGNDPAIRHTIQERCQTYGLSLHISFVAAWICRAAFRTHPNSGAISDVRKSLIDKCHQNLTTCVRAFIQLYSLRNLALRSWTILHNGLSSALLMSLLNFGDRNAEVHQLQGEIIDTLSTADDDETSTRTFQQDEHERIELSGPHTRILSVLKKLYRDRMASSEGQVSGFSPRRQPQPQSVAVAVENLPIQSSLAPEQRLYDEINPVWLMSPSHMDQGNISPLDYFNSLLWDPVEPEDPFMEQNYGYSGVWLP